MRKLEVLALTVVAALLMLIIAPAITGFAVFGQSDAKMCLGNARVRLFCADREERCDTQLDNIGSVKRYIEYIDCGELGRNQIIRCKNAKIQKYPTWSIHGHRIDRILTFEQLEKLTACDLSQFTPN